MPLETKMTPKNNTIPRPSDTKEPSGQGITDQSEYGKVLPWNQPIRYQNELSETP